MSLTFTINPFDHLFFEIYIEREPVLFRHFRCDSPARQTFDVVFDHLAENDASKVGGVVPT